MIKEYTSKDIKVVEEIEHVRLNPGMYIGDTSNPIHLIEECLDNALDETIAKYANIVAVIIDTKTNVFSVIDNGRGIPIDSDIPITISTKLFSGGKFKNSKTAYDIVAGKHGVGLVAVNALSEEFIIEVYRDGKHAKFSFKDTKLVEKKIEDFNETRPFSTKIQFRPSKKYFEKLIPDLTKLRKRLLISSVEIENCTFVLNIDKEKEIIKLSRKDFFENHCLVETDKDKTDVVNISVSDNNEKFDVMFGYAMDGSITPKVISSINLLPVESGGTHVNIFFDLLKDILTTRGKKLNLKFNPQDCLCGLRVYFSLYLKDPEYSGQTKDKLTNRREYFTKLTNKLKTSIENQLNTNKEFTETILNFFVDYRKKADSKKFKGETHGKRAATKFTKLRDCSSNHGELFIVEGDSAGGGFIDCRDPRIHAVFPLKGKIQSITTKKDILQHEEVGELIKALGCGTGPNFDLSKLKYSKIIMAADADEDGYHIFCLMTMVLANIVPDVIKAGMYYLAMTPLYGMTKGKVFIPLWTKKDVEEALKNNEKITRYKGLGELSPEKLKVCAIDEKTRKLVKVNYTENLENLMAYFRDSEKKRELLDDNEIVVEE